MGHIRPPSCSLLLPALVDVLINQVQKAPTVFNQDNQDTHEISYIHLPLKGAQELKKVQVTSKLIWPGFFFFNFQLTLILNSNDADRDIHGNK